MAAQVSNTMDQTDDQTLVRSLRSCVCPACGGGKALAQTMCRRCYYQLPRDFRSALYARLGSGYREAVVEAMSFLGKTEFVCPPAGEVD